MAHSLPDDKEVTERYLRFVKDRNEKISFNAEEKLKRIEELAEIIFAARHDYQSKAKTRENTP